MKGYAVISKISGNQMMEYTKIKYAERLIKENPLLNLYIVDTKMSFWKWLSFRIVFL